jgi:hypothetical protein
MRGGKANAAQTRINGAILDFRQKLETHSAQAASAEIVAEAHKALPVHIACTKGENNASYHTAAFFIAFSDAQVTVCQNTKIVSTLRARRRAVESCQTNFSQILALVCVRMCWRGEKERG